MRFRLLVIAVFLACGATGRIAIADTFALAATIVLQGDSNGGDLLVTGFEPDSSASGFPGERFESSGAARSRIAGLVAPVADQLPLEIGELIAAVQARDSVREWLPRADFPATPGSHRVVLRYVYRSTEFVIDLHPAGALGSQPVRIEVDRGQSVFAQYTRTASATSEQLRGAMAEAARIAWEIAREHGHVPGSGGGDKQAIKQRLSETFNLEFPGGATDYVAQVTNQFASGLRVMPVFAPREIAIELSGWKVFEQGQTESVAARLEKKRHAHEQAIRSKFDDEFPLPHSLVTADVLSEWMHSRTGKDFGIVPLRYEDERLVLGASDFASEQTYVLEAGASYDSTDGAQVTASVQVLHARRTRLEAEIDASYGSRADSEDLHLKWGLREPWAGWTIESSASLGSRSNDEALFGETTDVGEPIRWRRWKADAGITARRPGRDPSPGQWSSGFAVGLRMMHQDDRYETAAPVPESAAEPDTLAEVRMEWVAGTLLRESEDEVSVTSLARIVDSMDALGGHYEYKLAELAVEAGWTTSGRTRLRWKSILAARAGWIDGTAPLSRHFRAGGAEGWVRGLEEGEFIGTAYRALSVATGPDISALFGGGGADAFLLAFFDWGELEDVGRRTSVQSAGAAVSLGNMSVGGASASIIFGYACSPDSKANPRGTFFVRVAFPFVH